MHGRRRRHGRIDSREAELGQRKWGKRGLAKAENGVAAADCVCARAHTLTHTIGGSGCLWVGCSRESELLGVGLLT